MFIFCPYVCPASDVYLIPVALVALTRAQLGSVHCKVGCACSDEFKPLCGNDRQTYQNECKLRCSQCEKPGKKTHIQSEFVIIRSFRLETTHGC